MKSIYGNNDTASTKPVVFPNMERLLNVIQPLRRAFMHYEMADGVTIDQLSTDEKWLLGIYE